MVWPDLEEREGRLGFRDRQPILVDPNYRVDPRLSEFFGRSRFATRAQGTQESYALDYRLLFTIKSLAAEACLKRSKLTHKHTGLKGLFYALVKAQHARPVVAEDLQRDNDELRQAGQGQPRARPAQGGQRPVRPGRARP